MTLAPCRPAATLPLHFREKIGKWQGDAIGRGVKFPWASLEHWREDLQWYEFCLVQSSKLTAVNPEHVRPICVVQANVPERIPGGAALAQRQGLCRLGSQPPSACSRVRGLHALRTHTQPTHIGFSALSNRNTDGHSSNHCATTSRDTANLQPDNRLPKHSTNAGTSGTAGTGSAP